jgi:hypothetical protein
MTVSAERIESALERVAVLAASDPAFLPIFDRLKADLDAARNREAATRRDMIHHMPVEALLA